MNSTVPILLDTDPGSDIDDAVAIAYLLREPRCELVGITTVTGDVTRRAEIADALCQAAGRDDVPIFGGASRPLWIGPGQPNVPQYEALADAQRRRDFKANQAVEFLRRTIRSRPGEITLLTIGPLTNIAILFSLDPEIPSLLKEVVSMAGIFFTPDNSREWNCLVDPLAASIVYQSRLRRHTSFGLDVTNQCQMPPEDVRKKFLKEPLPLALKMAEIWFSQRKSITFHDPLAAVSIFHPQVCGYQDGEVQVKVDPHVEFSGDTFFRTVPAGKAPHRVADSVRADDFFEKYFSVFRG